MREKVRGEYKFSSLMKQKKRGGKLRCLLLCWKKIFFYIYDVITWEKRKKSIRLYYYCC